MKAAALVLAGYELARVVDALLQSLRPSLPEPGVTEAIGAQEHREGKTAPDVPAEEVQCLVWDRDVVDSRAVGEHPQHLANVGLASWHVARRGGRRPRSR